MIMLVKIAGHAHTSTPTASEGWGWGLAREMHGRDISWIREMARLQLIAILVGAAAVQVSGIGVRREMRSFSSAIKAGTIAAYTEKVLYEYESTHHQEPGVITEQWFTGKRMHSQRKIANPDISCNKLEFHRTHALCALGHVSSPVDSFGVKQK